MTLSESVMERSRLEEIISELVWKEIKAAQTAFNVLTDCVSNGVDIDDEDAMVSCVAAGAKGKTDERPILFILEQLNGTIEDT